MSIISPIRRVGSLLALLIIVAAVMGGYITMTMLVGGLPVDGVTAQALTNLGVGGGVLAWRYFAGSISPGRRMTQGFGIQIIIALLLTAVMSSMTTVYLRDHHLDPRFEHYTSAIQHSAPMMLVFGLLVASPLGEEALLRGTIYPILRQFVSYPMALIITTIAFVIPHGTLTHIPLTIALSLLSTIVYERTHNLGWSIATHSACNLITLAVGSIYTPTNPAITAIAVGWVIVTAWIAVTAHIARR